VLLSSVLPALAGGNAEFERAEEQYQRTDYAAVLKTLLAYSPKTAAVLSIFEGLPLEDVATPLDEDRELVKTARAIGLQQLTRRLSASPLSGKSPLPALPGLQYV
jgi:hypothetical protein